MRVVLESRGSFIDFAQGEKTLFRELVEASAGSAAGRNSEGSAAGMDREGSASGRVCEALVEVDADGSSRVLHRFRRELKEYHEFLGAKESFMCYRYKETGETFRLDSEYHEVPISGLLFEAAANTCFYDPDQQLLYCGEHAIEVWDAEKGRFADGDHAGVCQRLSGNSLCVHDTAESEVSEGT